MATPTEVASDEATLCFDSRPVYTLWSQPCRHGDLFVVQAEGGSLTEAALAGGVDFLMGAMPASAGFVTLYDLTAGMSGFVRCAPALMQFALRLRARCPGKQKAVIVVSPRDTERAWARWFIRAIPRGGVHAHVVATSGAAWELLGGPSLAEADAGEASEVGAEDASVSQGWVGLLPSSV